MILTSSTGAKIIYPDQKIDRTPPIQRFKGTAKTFAKLGGFTLVSVFIPVLHFVLVPVGAILTLTMTYSSFKKAYQLTDFEVHCPQCDSKFKTNVAGSDLPLRTFCSNCRNMVILNN